MCATCGDGNRTQYLMNISLAQCQLSYRPVHMVEAYTDIEKSLYINKKNTVQQCKFKVHTDKLGLLSLLRNYLVCLLFICTRHKEF